MRLCGLLPLISIGLQLLRHSAASFPGNIANQYYLNKQRFLLEILHHLQEPLRHEQWLALGQRIVSDEEQYANYDEDMRQYFRRVAAGRLLPKDVYYNWQQPEQSRETRELYHVFFNAREWSTFRQNICWARVHVNPALFLRALLQAMIKRDDYRALIMPKIYELLPAPYHSAAVVREASNFNYVNWIRQELMSGNQSQVQLVQPKQLLPARIDGDLRNSSDWSLAMAEVQFLTIAEAGQGKGTVSHLTEDYGWLSYWYYMNVGMAVQEPPSEAVRGWWYWQLGQIVARYKLERYGQQLEYKHLARLEQAGERERQPGYLLTWQSQRYQPEDHATILHLEELLQQLERDVDNAISSQSLSLPNGTQLDLRKDQHWLIGLEQLFPHGLSQFLLPSADQPQLLLDLHTMLSQPRFYAYAERLLHAYRSYRSGFGPSYQQSVRPSGMAIQEVSVSPLITFDEPVDVDLSNVLHARNFYYDKQFMWPHSLQARRQRLQHRPFEITFQVDSNRTQSVILRIFLTTDQGAINEEPFYQLDSFLTILYKGNNTVRRESTSFPGKVGDHIGYTELYHYMSLAEKDQYDFPLNITIPSCGFPRRLLLPRGGSADPLAMRLLIVATPYNYKAREGNELFCDFSTGVSSWDELPAAYPFERFVDEAEFAGSHVFWQAVEIKHRAYSESE